MKRRPRLVNPLNLTNAEEMVSLRSGRELIEFLRDEE